MLHIFVSFVLVQTVIYSISSSPVSISGDQRIQHASQTLNALQRVLDFFENDAKDINPDGVFCLRVAQGQLNALSQSLDSSTQLTDQKHIIQSFSTQIDRIAKKSIRQLADIDSVYFKRFSRLISREFMVEYRPRKLNQSLIEHNQEKDSFFDTELSDQCFSELLSQMNAPSCAISNLCWKKMTARMTSSYRLTHQLLWLLIAQDVHCQNVDLVSNRSYLEDFFCANIYGDANFNINNHICQDLFLEQLLLCSVIGYEEFLRSDWLGTILTWQDPQYNCFNNASEVSISSRHLLVEQIMAHGCLSHKTGLAAGVLATYARYYLQ